MTLYEFTIDVDLRTIIHSTEVQEYLFSIPVRWDGNIALIPHLFDEIGIAYSRKFTFGQKGTVMFLSNFSADCRRRSFPDLPKSKSNVQVPFRFSHCSRSNCGRGYSARGVSALKQDQLFSMNSIAAAKSFFIVIVCLSPSFPSTCRQGRKEDLCMILSYQFSPKRDLYFRYISGHPNKFPHPI